MCLLGWRKYEKKLTFSQWLHFGWKTKYCFKSINFIKSQSCLEVILRKITTAIDDSKIDQVNTKVLKEYTAPPTEEEIHLETSSDGYSKSFKDVKKKRKYCKLKISFLSNFLFKSIFFVNTKSSPYRNTPGKISRKFVFDQPPWAKVGSFWYF